MQEIDVELFGRRLQKFKSPFLFTVQGDYELNTMFIVARVKVNDKLLVIKTERKAYRTSDESLEAIAFITLAIIQQLFIKELFNDVEGY